VLAAGLSAPSGQRHQRRAADEDIETIIIKAHTQPVADKPGRHGVKDLAQGEAAAARDPHYDLLEVAGAHLRQWLQHGAFGIDALALAGIAPADDLINEAAIGVKIVK